MPSLPRSPPRRVSSCPQRTKSWLLIPHSWMPPLQKSFAAAGPRLPLRVSQRSTPKFWVIAVLRVARSFAQPRVSKSCMTLSRLMKGCGAQLAKLLEESIRNGVRRKAGISGRKMVENDWGKGRGCKVRSQGRAKPAVWWWAERTFWYVLSPRSYMILCLDRIEVIC